MMVNSIQESKERVALKRKIRKSVSDHKQSVYALVLSQLDGDERFDIELKMKVANSCADLVSEQLFSVLFEKETDDKVVENSVENSADDAPLPRWQDRLTFDSNVSDDSPVVKGTWITVAQIVSLVVDGYTWADMLRAHPELTEEDIRVCLSYATFRESDENSLFSP